jgi:replicative DNA helicase
MSPDQPMPSSTDAEKSILGAILLDNGAFDQTVGLKPEHFYLDGHGRIFTGMEELRERSYPIDLISIGDHLAAKKDLEAAGGKSYIAALTDGVPRRPSIAHYINIVRDKAKARELIHIANDSMAQAFDQTEPIGVVLARTEERLFELAAEGATQDFSSAGDIIRETYGGLEGFFNRDDRRKGLPTRLQELDDVIGGLRRKNLIILAARPSMGKTSLATNIAEVAAIEDRKKVAIFSLEMGADELLDRMACSRSGVNLTNLRDGFLKPDERQRVMAAVDELHNAPLKIDDNRGLSILDMRAKARRLARAMGGLDLIVVDYLQLMSGAKTDRRSFENRSQEVSAISRGLKIMAGELDVPVLALSQLNREAEHRDGNEPRLSDLRESGSLEQDADVVMLLFRPEFYDREDPALRGVAKVNVAKQRNGPTDTVTLNFKREHVRFTRARAVSFASR